MSVHNGGCAPANGRRNKICAKDDCAPARGAPSPSAFSVLSEFPFQWTLFVTTIPLWNSWIVSAMTYHLHYDLLVNFTNEGTLCPAESVLIPAASWTIGVFEPQRYVWLVGIVLHFPARIFWGTVYAELYLSATAAPHYNTQWYQFFARNVYLTNWVETYGLVFASVLDIDNCFTLHIVATVAWIGGACAFDLDTTIMHYASGWYHTSAKSKVLFWCKLFVTVAVWTSMAMVAFGYPYYRRHCGAGVYLAFTVAEYAIGLCEGAYYLLAAVDLYDVRVGLFARFDRLQRSNGIRLRRRCADSNKCCACGDASGETTVLRVFKNVHYKPKGSFCKEFGRFV